MSIFKFEFAHTIKQIWVIGEVMPEDANPNFEKDSLENYLYV